MAGFYGEYRHKLDAKNRLTLPAAIRKTLAEEDQLLIVPDPESEVLSVYTAESFEKWIDSIFEKRGGFDPNKREHMLLHSALCGRATAVSLDNNNHITLQAELRGKVGIDKDVTLVGMGNSGRFDIWDSARREKFLEGIDLSALLYNA